MAGRRYLLSDVTYYLFINITVVTALSGVVILIANNLALIPAWVFIGVFAVLTVGLVYQGWRSLKREALQTVGASPPKILAAGDLECFQSERIFTFGATAKTFII